MYKIVSKIFKDQKGSTSTLGLILTLPILMIVLFGGVDYGIMNSQFTKMEHMKNQYLERARLQGCLTNEDELKLREELTNMGFSNIVIAVEEANPANHAFNSAYNEENRAIRKVAIDNISEIPEIKLTIRGEFERGKYWMADLMAGLYGNEKKESQGGLKFKIEGTTFTEYVERS